MQSLFFIQFRNCVELSRLLYHNDFIPWRSREDFPWRFSAQNLISSFTCIWFCAVAVLVLFLRSTETRMRYALSLVSLWCYLDNGLHFSCKLLCYLLITESWCDSMIDKLVNDLTICDTNLNLGMVWRNLYLRRYFLISLFD